MLQDLKVALYLAVGEAVPEKDVAVAFSGGIDSSLLAKICKDLGKDVTLVTVGFPGSHDIVFSRVISAKLDLRQRVMEIDASDFYNNLARVRTVACSNTSHIENCIAYYYVAEAARQQGLNVVASANGCDELFCGYSGYRTVFEKGEAAVSKFMGEKIANELELVQEISAVARELGVEVRQPFLSPRFIEYATTIPLGQKIRSSDDLIRKHALRRVALEIGVPEESALKPKKALQYGSSIHKNFKKLEARG
jgi:asparagine synthase (glutamine-hydrolysing)